MYESHMDNHNVEVVTGPDDEIYLEINMQAIEEAQPELGFYDEGIEEQELEKNERGHNLYEGIEDEIELMEQANKEEEAKNIVEGVVYIEQEAAAASDSEKHDSPEKMQEDEISMDEEALEDDMAAGDDDAIKEHNTVEDNAEAAMIE